jgi:hypothetical protein
LHLPVENEVALRKPQLDHEGFLPLSGILTLDQLGSLRARVDELPQAEGDEAGTEFRQKPAPSACRTW